jgi:hypothetical protein
LFKLDLKNNNNNKLMVYGYVIGLELRHEPSSDMVEQLIYYNSVHKGKGEKKLNQAQTL